jgi:hypothetical protein
MKGSKLKSYPRTRRATSLWITLVLAAASAARAEPFGNLSVSSTSAAAKPTSGTLVLKVEDQPGAPFERKRRTIGVGRLFEEGKPLEVMVWGTGGAVAGSLGGPAGAVIGAGVGAFCGLVYSIFVVPHNGPKPTGAAPK